MMTKKKTPKRKQILIYHRRLTYVIVYSLKNYNSSKNKQRFHRERASKNSLIKKKN